MTPTQEGRMKTGNMLVVVLAVLIGAFILFGCEKATTPLEETYEINQSSSFLGEGVADSLFFHSGNGECGEPDTLVFFTIPPSERVGRALIGGGSDSADCDCEKIGDADSHVYPVTTHSPEDSVANFITYFELPEHFKDVTLSMYVQVDDCAGLYVNRNFIRRINMEDESEPGIPHTWKIIIDDDALFLEGRNAISFYVVNTGTGRCDTPAGRADSADCMYVMFQGRVDYTVEDPCEPVIDVKPGSDTNPINCKSMNGVIPVAILTTDCFDAMDVDHTTVRFGPDEAMEAHSNEHGIKRHEEDVDCDGDMDLVFHFRGYETGIACGDTIVTLTGELYSGETFEATDVIRTVPDPEPDDDGDCNGGDDGCEDGDEDSNDGDCDNKAGLSKS
jgi:hypothetical protein